ncbi:MAG: hypothetical protein EBZ11_03920, partial [Alphaproteobacteria bacterium]|nr:hypothetical protein [Alphaproteobacteria bacterium]
DQRRAAYRCDVTYGTNNEFGFGNQSRIHYSFHK